jgi:ferrous iron transport protein A
MLRPGEEGKIKSLTESAVSAKLLELGFLPGKTIRLIRKAPGGSPLYFAVNGHYIALRKEEAANILLDAPEK